MPPLFFCFQQHSYDMPSIRIAVLIECGEGQIEFLVNNANPAKAQKHVGA